jgi:hypothetical protein
MSALMSRFPTRTLVLMVLALLSFGWMWWRLHAHRSPKSASQIIEFNRPQRSE